MKIIAISDTHKKHNKINLPESDILIHAGDYSGGIIHRKDEFIRFLNWFEKQPAKYKIFISGNHDFFTFYDNQEALNEISKRDIIYLEDSSIVIEGFKIHGSPWSLPFFNWAYMKSDSELFNLYDKTIDIDTDILITHGPAYSILDKVKSGENVGSKALKSKIENLENLKLHIFGHIHEAKGIEKINDTIFCNASCLDLSYNIRNENYSVINL